MNLIDQFDWDNYMYVQKFFSLHSATMTVLEPKVRQAGVAVYTRQTKNLANVGCNSAAPLS